MRDKELYFKLHDILNKPSNVGDKLPIDDVISAFSQHYEEYLKAAERLTVLALKHCPNLHHDWSEVVRLSKIVVPESTHITVHYLHHGSASCGLLYGVPADWPAGQSWSNDLKDITCEDCRWLWSKINERQDD